MNNTFSPEEPKPVDPTPEEPKPEQPEEPQPGNGGGHGGGSYGGGGSSKHSSSVKPAEPDASIQVLPKTDPESTEPDIPIMALPKTGDTAPISTYMTMLTIGLMAAAYVMMADRKKEEE